MRYFRRLVHLTDTWWHTDMDHWLTIIFPMKKFRLTICCSQVTADYSLHQPKYGIWSGETAQFLT